MLWLSPLHHAGSSEQAGGAYGTVFVISSLRPPDRAEQPGANSAIPFQGPVPSLCVCGQPGPGVPAGLARLIPTQNPVSHSHRLLCFNTSPAASPNFPVYYSSGFIHPAWWECCKHGPGTQCPASASPTQQNTAALALISVLSNEKWEEAFFTSVAQPSYFKPPRFVPVKKKNPC